MKQRGVLPNTVNAILVTHLHGDHFGGIPFFILDAQFSKRETPLILAGPPGLEARVWQAMEVLFPSSSKAPRPFAIEFVEVAAEIPQRVGRLQVTAYPVIHACGAPPYALRVECAGRVLAYSGDTEWTDKLVDVADQADLFICEAYFFEKQVKFHLDYRTLLSHRHALRCKRLVLTHMNSDMLAHSMDLSIEPAHDGLAITL
jgi:ribonuclease BN (tRNA processing enzyme)